MILVAMLTIYAESNGLDAKGDTLFLGVAKNAPTILFVLFLLGVVAAAYSSADSALTSLTTAFCVDFMKLETRTISENESIRKKTHILFSCILFAVILIFKGINDKSVVENIFTAAGFTYGPLLGFFAFGMLTKYKVSDNLIYH
mgnify:CR=1 FL=1